MKLTAAQYIVRRTRDNRLIAGIFVAIRSEAQAQRILAEWQGHCPTETFHIETV